MKSQEEGKEEEEKRLKQYKEITVVSEHLRKLQQRSADWNDMKGGV